MQSTMEEFIYLYDRGWMFCLRLTGYYMFGETLLKQSLLGT